MVRTEERITDLANPSYGAEMGRIWVEIRDDPDHGAWDVVAMDAGIYLSLIKALRGVYGTTKEEVEEMSPQENQACFAQLSSYNDTACKITEEVVVDLGLYNYIHWDEDGPIKDAVEAGLHAAYLLAQAEAPEVCA